MKKNKIIGYSLLISIFIAMFIIFSIQSGLRVAVLSFATTIGIVGVIFLAAYFINKPEEAEDE